MAVLDKSDFLARVAVIYDGRDLASLTDDEVLNFMGVAQYATDVLLNEAEKRGHAGYMEGSPFIPYQVPSDVPFVETILTR